MIFKEAEHKQCFIDEQQKLLERLFKLGGIRMPSRLGIILPPTFDAGRSATSLAGATKFGTNGKLAISRSIAEHGLANVPETKLLGRCGRRAPGKPVAAQ